MLVSQNKAFELCCVHAKTTFAGIPKLSLKQGSRTLLTQSCGEGKWWCGETLLMGLSWEAGEITLLQGTEVWGCTPLGAGSSSSVAVRVALHRTALHTTLSLPIVKERFRVASSFNIVSGGFFVTKIQDKKAKSVKSARIGILPWIYHTEYNTLLLPWRATGTVSKNHLILRTLKECMRTQVIS